MKLTIKRTDLTAALGAVKVAAKGASSLPILTNVLLVANEKSVTLTATDLDYYLRVKVEADVNLKGTTTVRAGLLHDIARTGTGETISLELAKSKLTVICGETRFELGVLSPDDFPPFPRVTSKEAPAVDFELEDATLRHMLAQTAYAASTSEERFTLNGAFLALKDGKVTVAATDGRQLAVAVRDAESSGNASLILPSKAVRELIRLLNANLEKTSTVSISAGKNLVQFTFGDTVLVSKLIEGNYPNYTAIMPKAENPIATLTRGLLQQSVERISLVAESIKVTFSGAGVSLASHGSKNKDIIGTCHDSLLCACQRDLTAILGERLLHNTLHACDSDEFEVFANESGKILMFRNPTWSGIIAGMDEK